MSENYKLSKINLLDMAAVGILESDEAWAIVAAASEREPNKWAEKVEKVYLDNAGKIWVQNVAFYGGEHFGEPYYFVAEIRHKTSNSAFSRWWNREMPYWIKRNHFNY